MSENSSKLYFCSHCRHQIFDLGDVLLVENNFPRGFCSESCIEEYFASVIEYFDQFELILRKKYSLEKDPYEELSTHGPYLTETLASPKEIWLNKNEMGEEIYFYHCPINNRHHQFTMIAVCLVFERKPSYVLFQLASQDERLINAFKQGMRIQNIQEFLSHAPLKVNPDKDLQKQNKNEENQEENQDDDLIKEQSSANKMTEVQLDLQTTEVVDQKKSAFLAELIHHRSNNDIPMEDFYLYENYLEETLEDPDEVFQSKDDAGDHVFTYIKSYAQNNISFFYLVLCFKIDNKKVKNGDVLLPVLSFPSLDGELYLKYKKGEKLAGQIKS